MTIGISLKNYRNRTRQREDNSSISSNREHLRRPHHKSHGLLRVLGVEKHKVEAVAGRLVEVVYLEMVLKRDRRNLLLDKVVSYEVY